MSSPTRELLTLLEHRLTSVAIGHLALKHSMTWDEPPSFQVLFDRNLVIEGKATGFTNGAIEAAIVHCRALLEFLGLTGKNKTQLLERKVRTNNDDIGVEHFTGLSMLSIEKALSSYPGPRLEAESALAYVMYLANKGLAHTTSSFTKHDSGAELLEIAFRGIPVLVVNNFYVPLGIQPPDYKIQSRPKVI